VYLNDLLFLIKEEYNLKEVFMKLNDKLLSQGIIYSEINKNLKFYVVLIRPETAGNIGAIARIMKNFDFKNLVIFNPIESIDKIRSNETQGYAMHGKDILINAEIILIENQEDHIFEYKNLIKNYDLVIATTAKGSHFRNIRRIAIFPQDLFIPISKDSLKVALVFGRESHGLSNEEVESADILLRIPTSNVYPTLNLSHACGIVLYELYKKFHILGRNQSKKSILLANKGDRVILYNILENLLNKLKIRAHKKKRVYLAFKNIFERAFITKKELSLTLGVFSKIVSILKNLKLYKK